MTTDKSVSTNEPLLTRRTQRWLLAAVVAVVVVSTITYVGLRLQRTYEMEAQMIAMESRLSTADQQIALLTKTLETRVEVVERIVFGAWESLEDQVVAVAKQQAPTTVQVWQKNRDRELRERLNRLEKELWTRDETLKRLERLLREREP